MTAETVPPTSSDPQRQQQLNPACGPPGDHHHAHVAGGNGQENLFWMEVLPSLDNQKEENPGSPSFALTGAGPQAEDTMETVSDDDEVLTVEVDPENITSPVVSRGVSPNTTY